MKDRKFLLLLLCSLERLILDRASQVLPPPMASSAADAKRAKVRNNLLVVSQGRHQGFDEVLKHAIATTDTLDYLDPIHHFTKGSDYTKIIMKVTALLLLWFIIIYDTWLGMMKLSRIIFKWIPDHKRTANYKDVRFPRCILLSPIILITVMARINSTESVNLMLIVENLQPNTKDVRTEPGALPSYSCSTNISQNNSSLGDDHERFAKDRELRILVPTKDAFCEFVKVDHDPKGNAMNVTGYSVDVFKEVMDSLPYRVSYEFFPYKKGHVLDMVYYDELIQQLHFNRYDGVVGDITITSNRSKYGDFTLPYMMSGVSMIVPVADSHMKSPWWFLKPVTLKLWILMISLFLSKGLFVWFSEHENNPKFEGTFSEPMGKVQSFFFSIFVFAKKEKLKRIYSRLLLIFWIFGVFVLVTSYAAKLKSMITSDNDQPTVLGIEQLIMNQDYVGYQKGSFVFHLLKHMGFQEEKLKAYSSNEEYAIALSRGSCNNGVSAIIEEIPYIKVFLAKYGDRYTMAGPTFGPGGFGFLFRRGSTIVPDISRAVQKFIEGKKMPELEKKWFAFHD
ncbi:hypothetical protein MRB53_013366 [Persea americana]|uniref:Uncharacterized protein n=1 Tax=Persea americana TaxID=3435 RepID=A0ACC2K7X0_PERAE|nr:hypothetical protein MRB53_013366 [Persea americana]